MQPIRNVPEASGIAKIQFGRTFQMMRKTRRDIGQRRFCIQQDGQALGVKAASISAMCTAPFGFSSQARTERYP